MSGINIDGYVLQGEFTSENAGNSAWGCAIKNGKKYFIKQLKETYPNISYEDATPFQRDSIEISRIFESRLKRLYSKLRLSDNGNLVVPIDFLKDNGHYYVVTEWIDQTSDFEEIKSFTNYQKNLMMRVLAYSLFGLEKNNIVHSDLKPDNIRIKETVSGAKTLKIIDFDNGFIQGDYPDAVGGDQIYMSPELFARMHQEENEEEDKYDITPKSDIFTLGIIFHEILTGDVPKTNSNEIPYIGEAVGRRMKIELDEKLPIEYSGLIEKMLDISPNSRPDAFSIFKYLKENVDPLNLRYRAVMR
ncbi:MAG: protein kinase [Oscillospiraceae bacterium]|nr:protein kinase [Oscillospiraceae bacterium]